MILNDVLIVNMNCKSRFNGTSACHYVKLNISTLLILTYILKSKNLSLFKFYIYMKLYNIEFLITLKIYVVTLWKNLLENPAPKLAFLNFHSMNERSNLIIFDYFKVTIGNITTFPFKNNSIELQYLSLAS